MANEQLIKEISLFFFFSLLDEEKAFSAAQKTWFSYQDLRKKHPQIKESVLVIKAASVVWRQLSSKFQKGRPYLTKDAGWQWPSDLNMGPWMEFQKRSSSDELMTTIWCYIIGYSEPDVAAGLGLSEGTLRFRLGRAIRKIGELA